MGGRGAGAGSRGAASRWTDEDLGIGGIMDDADGTITDRQLQYIRDLQRKLQELADSGYTYEGAVSDKRREEAEERSRRLRAINPERMSRRGASRFLGSV